MPHYQRNIRFLVFLILPIISFLLGWTFNQRYSHQNGEQAHTEVKKEQEAKKNESRKSILPEKISISIPRRTDPKDVDLEAFWEAWNTVEGNFLYQDRFATKEQIDGAIRGLIDSLEDPYTSFMTAEESEEFEQSISGEFEGIGAEIAIRDEKLTIIAPIKGSPAEQAGLRPGDVIFSVDGEPTFGMSTLDAVVKIRGPKGEKVVLEITREGERKPLEITIVRDNIYIKNLEWEMRDDMAILEVSQFGSELIEEFNEALNEIVLENPKGIVVDLRNNGGGLLDTCLEFSDEFFSSQVIVETKGRKIGNAKNFISEEGGAFLDTPLVVLVNKGSASASEIFAGAVADNKRGVVIGEKTFGKGSVQNVIPLSNGASLKVTIAEWLTPDGSSIHDNGITPDEEIIVDPEDSDDDNDPILARALELLKNPSQMENLIATRAERLAQKDEPAPVSEEIEEELVETEDEEVEKVGEEELAPVE